jgi:NAD(P)-dependent dehydrogenase (short-subunit alcohol dehydrogenase family)
MRGPEVNLLGAVLTARAAIPHFAQSLGSMVLIGSPAATIGSPGSYVHYAAVKVGINERSVDVALRRQDLRAPRSDDATSSQMYCQQR